MSNDATIPADIRSLGADPRIFVVPDYKLVYASTPKNACTTLKWAVADLAGEDAASFRIGLRAFTMAEHAVHARGLWRKALLPGDVPPEVAAEIHPDNGWFVFGVVRDPRDRLFSAWQDKCLLRRPDFIRYAAEDWFPRFPESAEQIVEDFHVFVEMLAESPEHPVLADAHFSPQVPLLRADVLPFSRIYEIKQFGELRRDLAAHVEALGHRGDLALRRSNATPLKLNAAALPERIGRLIEKIYDVDFQAYGDQWPAAGEVASFDWPATAIHEAALSATYSERIGELREIGLARRREVERLRARLNAAGR